MSGATPYRPRLANPYLGELFAEFPAVMITGARATGKTNTAAQVAEQNIRLDEPGSAAAFRDDPEVALRRAARPDLLDEWQEVPQVLATVKRAVGRDATPGQFILTGSVRAEIGHATWAGTGRIVRMSMYPLVQRELRDVPPRTGSPFLARLVAGGADDLIVPLEPHAIDDYIASAVRGGSPETAYRQRSDQARVAWLESYIDDIVTRDAALLASA